MKRAFFPLILTLLLALTLAACSAKSSTLTGSDVSTGGNGDQPLSQAAQLLVGTLKLEGTDKAVDARQAADLLPLWQAYRQLINSDTAARAEIEAVAAQIQSTMTKDQVQAISAMKLTQKDMFTTMSSLGFTPGASAAGTPQVFTFDGNSSGSNPGAGRAPSSGGAPSGGGGAAPAGGVIMSGDTGGFPGGGPGQASSTQVAPSQARMGQVPMMLLNALVELLQKRAQP